MDRNTIIGLVMIAGIVLTWSLFFNQPPEPDPNAKKNPTTQIDSTSTEKGTAGNNEDLASPLAAVNSNPGGIKDSVWNAMSDSQKVALQDQSDFRDYGHFGKLRKGEEKDITIETDKMTAVISTKGAYIRSLYLKDYRTYDSLPLPIIERSDSNYMSLHFAQTENVRFPLINTGNLFFEASGGDLTVTGDAEQQLSFKLKIDDTRFLEYVYTFKGDSYDYGFEIRHNGLTGMAKGQDIRMHWASIIPKTEKAMRLMRDKTAIYYRESGDVDNLTPNIAELQEEFLTTGIDWFAFKSQFFSHTLLSEKEGVLLGDLKIKMFNPVPPNPEDEFSGEIVKVMMADMGVNLGYEDAGSVKYNFYAGPADYDELKKYDRGMIYQIELGWGPLKLVNRYLVIPMFNFLQGFFSSYGIIILILAFLIKLVLYPLTFRTYKSTAKMRIINQTPEIKALEEKYKDEPTKLQQEKMGIYRKMGVSMLGGCWPMLLQYPFLIALFFFFPNSIELRQQGFLWADDLSTYDSVLELGFNIPFYGDHVSLFTLLMTISIFAFTLINQRAQGTVTSNPVMKYFPYFMPIIFLGFLNNYSSGLSWYYLISNLISITQTVLTKRFIDEDALLQQMREKSKKRAAGKKGKSRIERWAEQQQKRQAAARGNQQQGRQQGSGRGGSKGSGKNYTKKKRR